MPLSFYLFFLICHVSIIIVIIITVGERTILDKTKHPEIDLALEIALTSSAYRAAGKKSLKLNGLDDITKEQFGILILLTLKDGLYQTQIANILGKDRPNITRMIDILENKGFIRREKDENNRRILKVFLTEKGQQKAEIAKPLRDKFSEVQYRGLSNEEIITLVKLLRKVRTNFKEEYNLDI